MGRALAALKDRDDVPWHRVINAQGRLSERKGGGGTERQRSRLIEARLRGVDLSDAVI